MLRVYAFPDLGGVGVPAAFTGHLSVCNRTVVLLALLGPVRDPPRAFSALPALVNKVHVHDVPLRLLPGTL